VAEKFNKVKNIACATPSNYKAYAHQKKAGFFVIKMKLNFALKIPFFTFTKRQSDDTRFFILHISLTFS